MAVKKLTVTNLNRWIKQIENADRALGNVIREIEEGYKADPHLPQPHTLGAIHEEVLYNRINMHRAKKMLVRNRMAMIEYQESQPQ